MYQSLRAHLSLCRCHCWWAWRSWGFVTFCTYNWVLWSILHHSNMIHALNKLLSECIFFHFIWRKRLEHFIQACCVRGMGTISFFQPCNVLCKRWSCSDLKFCHSCNWPHPCAISPTHMHCMYCLFFSDSRAMIVRLLVCLVWSEASDVYWLKNTWLLTITLCVKLIALLSGIVIGSCILQACTHINMCTWGTSSKDFLVLWGQLVVGSFPCMCLPSHSPPKLF